MKTQNVSLLTTKALKTRLGKLENNSKEVTLSLAFYSMIQGNVQPLEGLSKSIANHLHPVYRQFVCAIFNGKTGTWDYGKAKAKSLSAKIKVSYQETTFEEFLIAVEGSLQAKAAAAELKQAEEDALTPAQVTISTQEKIAKYLTNIAYDLTDLQLQVAVSNAIKAIKVSKVKASGIKAEDTVKS